MTDLSNDILILAYSNGYFPMPHPETEEICWFNPDPRAILPLDSFHMSRSLKKTIKRNRFKVTMDFDFLGVMNACADREDTWINKEIIAAYTKLFYAGLAHSVEVWAEERLVGGVYGVSIGSAFFAESKFHKETDASKVALWALVNKLRSAGGQLLEVQFITKHLQSLGVIEVSSIEYMELLAKALTGTMTLEKSDLPLN